MHPEKGKTVVAYGIAAANALLTNAAMISLKNVHKLLVYVKHDGVNATSLVLKMQRAKDVAGTDVEDVAATFPIWADTDAGSASDTLERKTAAATYTIAPATAGKSLVCFEIDPARVLSAGFDCVRVAATGGHGSNNVFAWYECEYRYAGPADTMPSAIVD